MTFLCIFFIPPLYLLLRRKLLACLVNCIFYGLAWLCVLSFIGIMVAPIFWLISVFHAGWYARKAAMQEQVELLATKMAEKMKEVNKQ